jgi:hypothetical protein
MAPGGFQFPPSRIFGPPVDDEQLARRVGEARTASPDTAARIWELQRRTGLPGAVIGDHLEEIEREAASRDFDAAKFRRESPYLAAWLQEDEQQAAIANDDLANMGLLEWLVTAPERAFRRSQAQVELAQLRTRSLFGPPLTDWEHRRLAELKRAMGAGGALGVGDSWFRGAVTGAAEQLPILWGSTLKGAERAAIAGPAAGTMAAIAAPLTGPATPFTVPAMTAGGVAAGVLAGGVEFGFQLEAGLAYDEFLEVTDELGRTIDPEVARVAAIATGAINAGLEAWGFERFLRLFPGMKSLLGTVSRPAVKEALRSATVRAALAKAAKAYTGNLTLETAVELAQEFGTILSGEAAKAASGVEGASAEDIAARLKATAVQSAQSFTLLSAIGPTLGVRSDVVAARQAEHNQTFFTALGEGVAQSKTAARNANAVQNFLATATKDGPLAHVYAPVDTWTTYWQSKNLDPAAMATELTGDSEAYARARREGTDLVIPTARYAAKLAGTAHNAFFAQELRTGPEQPNFREAKAMRAAVEARMTAAAAEAGTTAAAASPARQALVTQLEAAGVAPDEAARVADLHGAIVGTIGARAGQSEAQLVEDYPIAVTRPGFEGFNVTALPKEEAVTPPDAATTTLEQGGVEEVRSVAPQDAETALAWDYLKATAPDDFAYARATNQIPVVPVDVPREEVEAVVAEFRATRAADPADLNPQGPSGPTGTVVVHYEQRKGTGGKRGFISFPTGRGPRRFQIGLLKTADPSTLLHELGHFYLEVLGDLADGLAAQDPATLSDTQQRLVADYQAFLQFLGVESRDAITTEHHEKFARAFEAYLYEGKAPSVELRSAFASFAAWLTRVYRSIRALDVELSPEVRQLFDRLAATDEAIAAAQSEAEVSPLFTDAESAGMTELEFAAYQDEVREAHDREHEIVRTKVLADLKRADQAWWTKAKDAMTATVTAELQQDPVYRAMSVMRTGAYPDGTPFVEGEDPPVPIKLSRASLVAHYGKDILARLPRPYLYAKDSGITADAAAENFWFSSGDELLKAIIEAVPFGEMVAREVDRRMTAEYGDIFTDGRLEAEAAAIVQGGEHRQRIVQAELKALTKGLARSTIPSAAVLNEAARRQVAATKIRDLRPGLHLQAARRASKQAFELMATGQDRAGAVRAKLQELINLALYREARDTLERVESMRRTMRGYRSTTARQRFGKAGADYLTQIDALLDRYELARVTQKELAGRVTLAAFVDAQQKADIPIEIPQTLLNEARRINYLDVPVGEFTDVYDAVEHLARLSRLKNELLKAAKRRTFEEARDTLVGSILLHNDKQPTKVEFRPEDERRDFINDTFASHTKLAIHARALDGFEDGGEMWEQIIRPINEAGDAEAVMREDAITRMAALFKQAYPGLELGRLNRKLFIKEIGTSLSKEGRLLVALNWGNEDNRQRLLNDPKRQWNAAQIQAILETLDRRDWEFVQGVWDYVDSFWPAIEAKQKRVVGLAPEKVVATPVDTKFGQFRGGYFPINYDGRLVARAGVLKETGEATLKTFAAYVSATTRRGHTQARIDNVKMAVRLDFSVLFNHVDQVIHDLTHHEMLIDVNRLLEDRDVQAAIVDTRGHQVYRQFVNGLEDIAMGAAPAKNWGERAANFARGGTQVALLGLNFWTALQQPLGLFNGMFQVGPKWVIRGMKRWLRDAATMQSTLQWIHTKSAFMKDRATGGATQDLQDLRATLSRPNSYFDVLVRTATKDKVTQQNILNSFLWHITQAQKIADVPTWIGAYEKHMAQGDQTLSVEALEARAVALADQAVRDAQGSGRISDLAQVQRGGPIFKLFMTFYSYGNVLFNQTVEAYGRTEPSLKRPGNAAAFIGHLSLLYAFPALGLVVMSRALGRTGGDEDDESFMVEFGKEMLSAALNTMVGVRELGGLLNEGVRGYAGPAGTRVVQAAYQLGQQIKQGEVDEGLVGAATNVAGIIFRFPATQVQRTVEGFMALQEGRTRNPAVLLIGPPRD